MSFPVVPIISAVSLLICVVIWWRHRQNPTFAFFFLLTVLGAVGVILLFIQIPNINVDFAHALGHAFIIAAILAATVDHYVKERVLREVTLDVSKYLVGYRLPEELQDRIKELMQSKWIRRKVDVRVAFAEAAGGRKMKINVRISEEIQNITSEPHEYQDIFEYEKHDPTNLVQLECESEHEGCTYVLEGDALKLATSEVDGRMVSRGQPTRILPVALSLGRAYRFKARYEVTYPTTYSELISFSHPTIGVVVEIIDAPKGYRFHVTPQADFSGNQRWEYKRMFGRGEHLRIHWEPQTNEGKK